MARLKKLTSPAQYKAQSTEGRKMDEYCYLIEAIVLRAVKDLRELNAGFDVYGVSKEELYQFFTGTWGQAMLGKIDGEWLYEALEKEARDADRARQVSAV
jgi:hypothetical protein